MRLLGGLFSQESFFGIEVLKRKEFRLFFSRKITKESLSKFHGAGLMNLSGECDDGIVRRIEGIFVLLKIFLLHRHDHLFRSDRIPSKWMITEDQLFEIPCDAVHWSILIHALLFDNHTALFIDLLRRKTGMKQHVRKNVTCEFNMFCSNLHVVTGVFFRGKRIKFASHTV